jgi:hypothetical protein
MEKISGANYFEDGWKSPGGSNNRATLLLQRSLIAMKLF